MGHTGYGGPSTVFMNNYSSLNSRKCAFEYFLKELEQMYLARPAKDLGIHSILVLSFFYYRYWQPGQARPGESE